MRVSFFPDGARFARGILLKFAGLLVLSGVLCAQQQYDQYRDSDRQYLLQLLAGVVDLKTTTFKQNGYCAPSCQELSPAALNLGYRTVITDFDAKTGVTTCEVYYPNGGTTSFTANTLNTICVQATTKEFDTNELTSLNQRARSFSDNITYAAQTSDYLPLSRFMAALLTLDPEVIDFVKTEQTGIIELKNNYSLLQINQQAVNSNGTPKERVGKSVADSFNKANLAFYGDLFVNLGDIYGYLQNLLFVFMGMFFMGRIGFEKGMRALDKSKSAQDDTQWLSRFYIPLVTVGFFFAPMPEDAGMNATIVQKMIRYMVTESTIIADKASAVVVNSYTKKLYATVGAMSAKGEQLLRGDLYAANASIPIYNNAFKGNNVTCKVRFPTVASFVGTSAEEAAYIKRIDQNNVSTTGSGKQDITFDACTLIEYRMMVAENTLTTTSNQLKGIEKTYQNDKLTELIRGVNGALQEQQNKLGWTNAIIIPSASMLVEALPLVQSASIQSNSTPSFSGTIKGVVNSETLGNLSKILDKNSLGGETNNTLGTIIGNFAYMAMPGSRGVYAAFHDNPNEAVLVSKALQANSVDPKVVNKLMGTADKASPLIATSAIYEWFLAKLPIGVSVIAGVIAFVGYIIELAKYFYISPFVVAFALTTKKTHKIVDFLVTGLTIFFKPILMVVFIALSLFIFTIVQDIFIYFTQEEFEMLVSLAGRDNTQSPVILVIKLLVIFFKILGSLGATYIMWKLILTGPTWAMKMVGVDNAQNDMVSEALSQRMDRAGFNM